MNRKEILNDEWISMPSGSRTQVMLAGAYGRIFKPKLREYNIPTPFKSVLQMARDWNWDHVSRQ